jgi:hypothetical protein
MPPADRGHEESEGDEPEGSENPVVSSDEAEETDVDDDAQEEAGSDGRYARSSLCICARQPY